MELKEYILEKLSNKNRLKLSKEDKEKLLSLDKEYNNLIKRSREGFNEKDVLNLDEEMDKFFKYKKEGKKYYPNLKLNECKYTKKLLDNLIELRNKFYRFQNCYLSKYYIECLDRKIKWVDYQIKRHNGEKIAWDSELPSFDIYQKALKILKSEKYQSSKELNRNINSEQAAEQIDKALKELNYPWKVSIEPDMLARMNVQPNDIIRISKTAKFNDADIEGLIAHEIKGHIGRRYYGKKTGLYLFLYGLLDRNCYDEGLAVWNSLNLVKHDKPNVMLNITLKYIICYNKYRMDFCQLFDFVKNLVKDKGIPDSVIFKSIARAKREVMDTSILGGIKDDGDYFKGYLLVNELSNEQRDDILKYNIGPEQLVELDDIKEFLKVNEFEPLI